MKSWCLLLLLAPTKGMLLLNPVVNNAHLSLSNCLDLLSLLPRIASFSGWKMQFCSDRDVRRTFSSPFRLIRIVTNEVTMDVLPLIISFFRIEKGSYYYSWRRRSRKEEIIVVVCIVYHLLTSLCWAGGILLLLYNRLVFDHRYNWIVLRQNSFIEPPLIQDGYQRKIRVLLGEPARLTCPIMSADSSELIFDWSKVIQLHLSYLTSHYIKFKRKENHFQALERSECVKSDPN